jgi:hypothetical protein
LDYLVLKTKYNPIWHGVKIGPICNAMVKYWGWFATTDQMDLLPIRCYTGVVGVKEVIVSETRAAQRLILARMGIAFCRTTTFGDMVNCWNNDLVLVEEPKIELSDCSKDLEVRTDTLIITYLEGGFSGKEFYGK